MTAAQRARHRDRLLALRAEILHEGDLPIEPSRTDATRVGGDEDEQPLAEMNQVITSKRNRSRTEVLARVTAALRRLDETPDDFGLCRECEEPIGKRLDLLPYVELCTECQQARDGAAKPGRRRHLTDYR
jgi:DnaK suppressor protein